MLVTGGTGVIGKAAAASLAATGGRVAVTGRHQERAEQAARAISRAGGPSVDVNVADVLPDRDKAPKDLGVFNTGELGASRTDRPQGRASAGADTSILVTWVAPATRQCTATAPV